MIIWTMTRSNGDVALVRTIGNEYCADVTTSTGRNDNDNWPEVFKNPMDCRKHLEKWGFEIA